ncbi:MAG: hypothetical protein NWE93_04225 [Candidatus Bathyarchaeota archaeon]|nr:hypothetical protein [Candidatus Bathyarchaeota archaeon]
MHIDDKALTSGLCEFVGSVIGNGNLWTDGSRYRVEITGDPKLDLQYFNHLSVLCGSLFSKKPYPMRIHQRGLRLRLQSKEAYSLLSALGIPAGKAKSHKVTIPNLILEKGWAFSKWTLRGIMDTDGTVFYSKKTYEKPVYPTIEVRTCSKPLAIQINELLQQQTFRPRLRGDANEGYHVALYGNNMLNRWVKEISFSNSKHLNKIHPPQSENFKIP